MSAAVTQPKANAASASGRRVWRIAVLLLLIAGFGLTVLAFYPGYITVDAQYVYAEAQAWHFGDWQSPAMAVLWRFIDPMAPGSASMFLFTAILYWGSFAVLALLALRSSKWLGLLVPFLALVPPAFVFLGMIWRDVQFGVIWLCASALAFAAACTVRRRGSLRVLTLALIGFGVLLRPNAALAAPLLATYAIWPGPFMLRRTIVVFVPLAAFFVALVPIVYYGLLGAERQHPLHSILVFDLGGITHFTGENQFPVSWSPEQNALLTTRCYDPAHWDTYWHLEPCPFVMQRLEDPSDRLFGSPRLLAAWWHAVAAHPLAYLAHRAAFMRQFLLRSNLALPVWDWDDPESAYGRNPYFTPVLKLHNTLQPTPLFWPAAWLLAAAAICVLSFPWRGKPAGGFSLALASCAVLYILSFAVLGVAADFRYAYWAVLSTLAALVPLMIVMREHQTLLPPVRPTSEIHE
jgi:hypothetical protein